MNGTVTLQRNAWLMLAGLSAVLPMLALASASTTLTVKVTVVAPPPCVVNNDQPIEVEFGDVMTTRVDGDNYKMPVNYTLRCVEGHSNEMRLQVKGSRATFDGTLLQTNKVGLGIELRDSNGKVAVNNWLEFSYPKKPVLWAVPVKQLGATLTGGEFRAGATMKVDYQ
jgi:type 1 fimbria pilin